MLFGLLLRSEPFSSAIFSALVLGATLDQLVLAEPCPKFMGDLQGVFQPMPVVPLVVRRWLRQVLILGLMVSLVRPLRGAPRETSQTLLGERSTNKEGVLGLSAAVGTSSCSSPGTARQLQQALVPHLCWQ